MGLLYKLGGALVAQWIEHRTPNAKMEVRFLSRVRMEGWQNGYCAGPENRWAKALTGSSPVPSAGVFALFYFLG